MNESNDLIMKFDMNTIEHLGVKMYSNLPTALAELIANSYDADAKKVNINLIDNIINGESLKEIIVQDNGIGMDFDEINKFFLVIGRNRRTEGYVSSPDSRKVTGKKGLGKLSLFGIGNTIVVSTTKKGSNEKISFTLNYAELKKTHDNYKPAFKIEASEESFHGTTITLKDLKRKSSFDLNGLSISLSKLFNLFDDNFRVNLSLNDSIPIIIDNKLKYEHINYDKKWVFSNIIEKIHSEYVYRNKIFGEVYSSEKPLITEMRGITLYANGRLVNSPEFFGVSESSHGFSYITGWLNVDFVDDWPEDVISTNRQSLNWDLEKTIELRDFLRKCMSYLERDWRQNRNMIRNTKIQSNINFEIDNWIKILPEEIKENVRPIVETIINKSELNIEEQTEVISNLHVLIPEYPYYHWRHLHNSIHEVSEIDYQQKDYLRAAHEAVKKYIKEVQNKSGTKNPICQNLDGQDLMFKSFGENGILKSTNCNSDTEKNIEEGQKFLSGGIVRGFRNPVSHETKHDIYPNIFNDKDCLDVLSLISYLFGKLDKSN